MTVCYRVVTFCLTVLGLASAAQAAPTKFVQSTDCYPLITVSNGGLTVSDGGVSNFNSAVCRANKVKYSGKLYFEFTYGSIGGAAYVGITAPSNVPGAPDPSVLLSEFSPISGTIWGVLGYTFSGDIQWESSATSGTQPQTAGHTGAFAADFDTDPIQVFFTNDLANLVCDTGGGTGTNAPMWNNDCGTSGHPVGPTHLGTAQTGGFGGTVRPNDGTGHTGAAGGFGGIGPFIPGYQWEPVFQGANPGSTPFTSVTFNFGATSFAATIPSGYSSWDSGVGDTLLHPPVTVNVANAPVYSNGATMTQGVAASHTLASRLDGGPGCNKSGFTNGSDCFLWQALNGGTTSSSGDPSATWACATPANTGGIYATSFPGATTVTDNGVTFACLAKLNYTTLTSAFGDGPEWTTGTNYYYGDVVRHAGVSYMNQSPMTTAPWTCVSGATFAVPSDGGCTDWQAYADIQYSANVDIFPFQNSTGATTGGYAGYGQKEIMFNWPITFELFSGGHDRNVYQPGVNGEDLPILDAFHVDWTTADLGPSCYQSAGVNNFDFSSACQSPSGTNAGLGMAALTFTVPAGDSYADNTVPGTDPVTSSDPTRGMTGYSNKVYGASPVPGGGNPFGSAGEPIGWSDSLSFHSRMQLWSANGQALPGHNYPSSGGPGSQRLDNCLFDQMIIESDGTAQLSSFSGDGGCSLTNSLVIDRSTVAGHAAVDFAYETVSFSGNTIIGTPGVTNSAPLIVVNIFGSGGDGTNGPVYNNVFFGFSNCYATGGNPPFDFSDANATDLASCPVHSYTSSLGNSVTSGTGPVLTETGITPSAEMVQPSLSSALDIRLKNTGVLFGNGVNFSDFSNSVAHDIIGTARPQSQGFDIGAVQSTGGTVPPGNIFPFVHGMFGSADAPLKYAETAK